MNHRPLRILIVTPTLPYPPNWGFGIRVYNIIRELSKVHQVSLLCYALPEEQDKVAALDAYCHSVHVVPPPFTTEVAKRRAQMLSLFSPRSFQSSSVRTATMRTRLKEILASGEFDLVQIESSQLASYAFGSNITTVLDEHNIEYELLRRMRATEKTLLRKFYNLVESRKFRREEESAWQGVDGCVFTSDREETVMHNRLPSKATHVAPNGVDIEYFRPHESPVDADTLIFTGLISYRPNHDAVLFFVNEILPLILRERPTVKLLVVGLGAPPDVLRLASENVIVTGAVPDIRPYMERATAVVVPLRMGSGTRLKVLEGLAMGKAMISTSIGCEGINVTDGRQLLIADDPSTFARTVLKVLDDQEMSSRLGREGRQMVEDTYSWNRIVSDLEIFYRRLIEGADPIPKLG